MREKNLHEIPSLLIKESGESLRILHNQNREGGVIGGHETFKSSGGCGRIPENLLKSLGESRPRSHLQCPDKNAGGS